MENNGNVGMLTGVVHEAMVSKINLVMEKYDAQHEALLEVPDVSKDIQAINARMWKSMTKDEITDSLIRGDVLTVKTLTANPKVQKALDETQAVYDGLNATVLANTQKYLAIQEAVDVELETIGADAILFGLEAVQTRLKRLDDFIANVIATA